MLVSLIMLCKVKEKLQNPLTSFAPVLTIMPITKSSERKLDFIELLELYDPPISKRFGSVKSQAHSNLSVL